MTLRDLCNSFGAAYIEELGDYKVRNYDDFCLFAVRNYLISPKCMQDQRELQLDVEDGLEHDYLIELELQRAENLMFNLKVVLIDD